MPVSGVGGPPSPTGGSDWLGATPTKSDPEHKAWAQKMDAERSNWMKEFRQSEGRIPTIKDIRNWEAEYKKAHPEPTKKGF